MKTTSEEFEARCYIEFSSWINLGDFLYFGSFPTYVIFADIDKLTTFIERNKLIINKYYIETNFKNKLMDYFPLNETRARIEKGAIIRSGVKISDSAIILMGAIVNTSVTIGDKTMIDMNAVIGSGAIIKNNCHIGAGSVIAGMMEPMSNIPVIIEDDVLIGANATILNGVKIGKGSIVGAGSVVTMDVADYTTVAGVPAKVINNNGKWIINDKLR